MKLIINLSNVTISDDTHTLFFDCTIIRDDDPIDNTTSIEGGSIPVNWYTDPAPIVYKKIADAAYARFLTDFPDLNFEVVDYVFVGSGGLIAQYRYTVPPDPEFVSVPD